MRSTQIRSEIRLFEDEFVVMPNHHHAIVWIIDTTVGADGVRPDNLPSNKIITMDADSLDIIRPNDSVGAIDEGASHAPQRVIRPFRRGPKSLGSFIAGFKASVTSRANHELNMTGIWQRNYYEHIIRNEKDLKNIWHYIDNNPRKWAEDRLHPSAPPNIMPRSQIAVLRICDRKGYKFNRE